MSQEAAEHFQAARDLIVRACARGTLADGDVALLSDSVLAQVDATLDDLREGQPADFILRLSEPLPGMLEIFAGPFGLRGELAQARERLVQGLAALAD